MLDIKSLWLIAVVTLFSLTVYSQNSGKHGKPAIPAATPLTKTRDFSWRDLFKIKRPSDIQISPNGKAILYVRSTPDTMTDNRRSSIWIINCKTGMEHQWRNGSASSPRWSPDGRQVAYLARNDKGNSQLFISDAESPQQVITNLPENASNITWSPDGKYIAFTQFMPEPAPILGIHLACPPGAEWAKPGRVLTAKHIISDGAGENEPGYIHLFLVSASGGKPRQLTFGRYSESDSPVWTPDGKSLIFSTTREENWEVKLYTGALYRLQLDNLKLTKLTKFPYAASSPSISPDGKTIAFLGLQNRLKDYEPGRLFLMNADGSNIRQLASTLERNINQLGWSTDGKAIIAVYDDYGITKVNRIGLDGTITGIAENLDGDGAYSMSLDGSVAFPLSTANRPPEVAICAINGPIRQLSHLNDILFNQVNIGMVQKIPVVSSFDGKPVGAWILLPPRHDASKRYPLIISIHGGPHGNDGPRWSSEAQLYAGAGYIVLKADYRGSTSYGFDFADKVFGDFPGYAYDDLMSAVDAAVKDGFADSSRLFVTGGSAGGELTAWIVGKTDRFKAAAAVKPVISHIALALNTDQYVGNLISYPKDLWEDPMKFWTTSPLSLANKVTTPTLILVGEDDRRTPVSESMQFYNALQLRDIPTALVIVPQASHETLNAKPSQLANNAYMILDWFGRYGGIPIRSIAR